MISPFSYVLKNELSLIFLETTFETVFRNLKVRQFRVNFHFLLEMIEIEIEIEIEMISAIKLFTYKGLKRQTVLNHSIIIKFSAIISLIYHLLVYHIIFDYIDIM